MANRTVEQDMDLIRADLAKLRDDLSALTTTIRDSLGEVAEAQGSRLRAAAATARGQADEWLQQARARGEQGVNALEQQIEERPLTSLLVAFGIGVLIGKLLDR